jgi:hypothetical protein
MKTDAALSSESSITAYHITRRNIPGDNSVNIQDIIFADWTQMKMDQYLFREA